MGGQVDSLVWLIVCFGIVGFANHASPQTSSDTKRIDNAEQATEMALALAGIGRTPRVGAALSTTAARIQLVDSTTPILWRTESPIDTWEVTIDGHTIDDRELCGIERSYKIWMAAETGEFIRATISKPAADTLKPMRLGEYYETQLSNSMYTIVGLPGETPPFALTEALLVPVLSRPCRAVESVVWYIVMEWGDRSARPYWCIVGRGVPFLDLHGKHTNEKGETPLVSYMTVIDATTGQAMTDMTVR